MRNAMSETHEEEVARLKSALELETQARVACAEGLADAQATIQRLEQTLDGYRRTTCAVHGVEDEQDPRKLHIVRGTLEGIKSLEAFLRRRYREGIELGRALAEDGLRTDMERAS